MVNIWRVMTYEISRTLRRKGFLFATFVLPFLLFALSFVWQRLAPTPEQMVRDAQTMAQQMDGLTTVGFVDLSGEFSGVESEGIVRFDDEASAIEAMQRGEIEAVYILPEDYAETRTAREIIPQMAMDDITGQPLIMLAAAALESEIEPERVMRLQNPANVTTVDLNKIDADGNPIASDTTPEEQEDAGFTLVYIVALLFIMTTFTGSGYLMQSVIEEKENRLIEVLITTVRPSQLLAGKVLAGGLMALFQVGMWAVIAVLLMQVQGPFLRQMIPFLANLSLPVEQLPIVAVYFLVGFFMFAALFGMVGALSNSAQEGPQMTVVFVLPAMIPLWVTYAFVTDPNGTVPTLLSMFPLTAPIAMMMRLVVTDVPLWQVGLSLAILVGFVIALYWLAGRLFRVQILLSGKMPRLRDIPKLVFSQS
jgi:ABC-2 type transport system permease protein